MTIEVIIVISDDWSGYLLSSFKNKTEGTTYHMSVIFFVFGY